MLTFHKNGVVDYSPGTISELPYRIEGGEVVFPPAVINGPERREKIAFTGRDKLRLGMVDLTRVGSASDAAKPILGEWVGTMEMDKRAVEARYIFYPTGRSLFLIKFKPSTGRYTVSGPTIRLDLPGNAAASGEFRIDDDMLTLPGGPHGMNYRLKRY